MNHIETKKKISDIIWKCTLCGYEHKGENPPEKCPKCGASKAMFEKISG